MSLLWKLKGKPTPTMLKKYSNLVKIMQLPGTTMNEEATKQMGEYAKNPKSYLKDVNEMVEKLFATEGKSKNNKEKQHGNR